MTQPAPSQSPVHWIVVPCYNEAQRLPAESFRNWLAMNPSFGVLFVNDGSIDDTARIIADLSESIGPQAGAMNLASNSGKAEAVRRGMISLLDRGARTIGYLDADLATPLDEMPRLLTALEETPGCDIALGSRVRLLGRDIRRRPGRHYLGRFFATATSLTLRLAVYDTQCGAKLFRMTDSTPAMLSEPFISRWIFDVELLARFIKLRNLPSWPDEPCGVVEVPLRAWRDVAGSKVRASDFVCAASDLWKIARRYRLSDRPAKPLDAN
jgi:glycosyltransferase involved in cell wall biosynthesis